MGARRRSGARRTEGADDKGHLHWVRIEPSSRRDCLPLLRRGDRRGRAISARRARSLRLEGGDGRRCCEKECADIGASPGSASRCPNGIRPGGDPTRPRLQAWMGVAPMAGDDRRAKRSCLTAAQAAGRSRSRLGAAPNTEEAARQYFETAVVSDAAHGARRCLPQPLPTRPASASRIAGMPGRRRQTATVPRIRATSRDRLADPETPRRGASGLAKAIALIAPHHGCRYFKWLRPDAWMTSRRFCYRSLARGRISA